MSLSAIEKKNQTDKTLDTHCLRYVNKIGDAFVPINNYYTYIYIVCTEYHSVLQQESTCTDKNQLHL